MSGLGDTDASWRHYAFTYDETGGIAGTAFQIGGRMDYSSAGQGTMDEVRLDNTSLAPSAFLIPEPSSSLLLGAGLVGIAAWRRHRDLPMLK